MPRHSKSESPSRRVRGELLQKFRAELASVEPFTAERLEQLLHAFVESQGIKIGDIVHAVRVAVTGKAVGFGLFDTLAILGRERSLARIDRALQLASAQRNQAARRIRSVS